MSNYKNFESIKKITNLNEVVDGDDWTHFHYICISGTTTKEMLEYCLKNGANLNIENIYERTPFSFICEYNKYLSHYMGSGYTG